MSKWMTKQLNKWAREWVNKWVCERVCNWKNEWINESDRASACAGECVCGAEYWSGWGGGSFVMNKSFCAPHTAVGRANTDPSQHAEGMWLNPLTKPISPHWPIPTNLIQKLIDSCSVNAFLSQAENLHRSGLQDDTSIIRSAITYSSASKFSADTCSASA